MLRFGCGTVLFEYSFNVILSVLIITLKIVNIQKSEEHSYYVTFIEHSTNVKVRTFAHNIMKTLHTIYKSFLNSSC